MKIDRRLRIGGAMVSAMVLMSVAAVPGQTARPVDAAPPALVPRLEAVSVPAGVAAPAQRLMPVVDVVSIGQSGVMSAANIAAVERAAAAVNVPTAHGRAFNVGLWAVRRNEAPVQLAGEGESGVWQFPMSATALPVEAIGRIMTASVAGAISRGEMVLNRTSADLRGARVGDTLDLIAADGNARRFVLGHIAPDADVGGSELVMSTEQADLLGADRVTRVVLFGQIPREALDAALAANGLVDGLGVRINKSWNPFNPDSVLGSSRTKLLLGEFDYRINSNDTLTLDQDWVATNVQRVNFASVGIRASCHRQIVGDIQAALDEIAAAGLGWAIDLGVTNTYGGCFNPRFARISASFGSVSRHAWAMALDVNTDTNGQGNTPRLDCRVVRIFRKHNFAWGGNFLVPDGMHFEWVGEPRNTYSFPSRFCPNVAGGGFENESGAGAGVPVAGGRTERDVMFAEFGGVGHDHHD